jgi:hypothetical protein
LIYETNPDETFETYGRRQTPNGKPTPGFWHEAKKESKPVLVAQLLRLSLTWLAQPAFLLGAFPKTIKSIILDTMRSAVIFCRSLQKITE